MRLRMGGIGVILAASIGVGLVSSAGADNRGKRPEVVRAQLTGYSEVPSQSSAGRGLFRAVIDAEAETITYSLSYANVAITQSHLHFGQHHTNGNISVFLCTNLGNAPSGVPTQPCPAAPAEINGVISAASVVALAAAQGIAAGEFGELVAAIRNGSVYVNIHTTGVAAGEIRGQLH